MNLAWAFDIAVAAATLVAISNPLGALPVYLSLRGEGGRSACRLDALHAAATVALCLLVSALIGMRVLSAFGVSLAGFRAAGGFVVTLLALGMVQGRRPGVAGGEADTQSQAEAGVYMPVSIPLIAGPGAITAAITLAAKPGVGYLGTLVAILAVTAAVFLTLCFAPLWKRLLGDFGLRLAARLLGLLVMAVGVQMAVTGLRELWSS